MKTHAALILMSILPAAAAAQNPAASSAPRSDPFTWLEDVDGPRAMAWVEQQNERTARELQASAHYAPIVDRVKAVLDSDDRIPYPGIRGEHIYNLWQDADNPRGVWRRTTWDSYATADPRWEMVLDIDALAKSENVPWSLAGFTCLEPDNHTCMVLLSRGGSDANEAREFDAQTKQFVRDGFTLPDSKGSIDWIDRNTLLIARDFGDGTLTSSGYPRQVRLWRRGTRLEDAGTLMEIPATDMGVWGGRVETAVGPRIVISHAVDFYTSHTYMLVDGSPVKLDIPLDATAHFVRDQLVVYVRSTWKPAAEEYGAGTLVAIGLDDFLSGSRAFTRVLVPGVRESVSDVSATRNHLLVTMLNNVRGELRRYTPAVGSWVSEKVPAPDLGTVAVQSVSASTDRFFFSFSGFTQPETLYLGDESGVKEVRRLPAMFNADGLVVEQREAVSKDGTRIPYFIVSPNDTPRNGTSPTLLTAYGGFEVSRTAAYSPVTGAAWMERGGSFVLANIRGGGEFGPQWHRAGLKENRQRVYDDFIAVAEDIIGIRLTSPRHLGIMGGSNGGLLVGVAVTQRPDLFGAVVSQVPLLDMQRYSHLLAGASWMAEYGNPDIPEEWAYISRYSPYHNLKPDTRYPRVLFTTTTRDDRVHPGHARKMAAKMESMGLPFLYFENVEGGHGAGVTSDQKAKSYGLTYTYLWEQLKTVAF